VRGYSATSDENNDASLSIVTNCDGFFNLATKNGIGEAAIHGSASWELFQLIYALGGVTVGTANAGFKINSAGQVTQVNNINTVGTSGVSYAVGHANVGAFSTTQSGNVVASPVASQAYSVKYYMWQAASGSGGTCTTNATATLAITWTDPSTSAQTQIYSALYLTPTLAAGAWQAAPPLNIVTASGTAIAYSITYANGNCSTQPTAQAQIWAEAEN
jgi:hypothetical protein